MRKAHKETFEISEAENYIIQLLRLNLIIVSFCFIMLIEFSNNTLYGFKTAIIGGIGVIILVTLLGFLNSAFGFNPAEWIENRI